MKKKKKPKIMVNCTLAEGGFLSTLLSPVNLASASAKRDWSCSLSSSWSCKQVPVFGLSSATVAVLKVGKKRKLNWF